MDTPQKQDVQSRPPRRCGICGSEDISVYGPFEGLGLNAECRECGAQYWTKSGWIDPEEL